MSDVKNKRIALVFGSMKQNVAAEHLALAELEAADNVEMEDDGTWIKRPGLDRTVPIVDTGNWTTGGGGAAFDGYNPALLDGADRCWTLSTVNPSTYRNRGLYPRGYNKSIVRAPVAGSIRTVTVEVSTNTWIITQTQDGYVFEIINTLSRARVLSPQVVAFATAEALTAVANSTHVWIFLTSDNTVITAHRITIATPTVAPTSTTYLTTAGANWQSIDAFTLTASTEIVVVASGINATTAKYMHSYLDPATGAARAAPATVIVSNATTADFVVPAGNDNIQLSISILSSTGSGTFFYTLWDQNVLKLVEVTSATLAALATTTLLTESTTGFNRMRGIASGYVDVASGNWVVFASNGRATSAGVVVNPSLARFTKNGGSFTNTSYERNYWVASRPATVANAWYVLVQYESYLSQDEAALLQRTLYLMSADGHLVARVAPGQARSNTTSDEVWPTTPDARTNVTDRWFSSAMADVTGTVISGTQQDHAHNPVFIDIVIGARTFGRPVKYATGKVCIPAGIPGMFGSSDRAKALTPLMFPTNITAVLGTSTPLTGETGVAIVYRLVDADGTITRSSPNITAFTFTITGTRSITFDNLRVGHASLTDNALFGDPLGNVLESHVEIEVYLTEVGESDLRLFKVLDNDPSTQTQTLAFVPTNLTYVSTELLYTTGGRLSNAVAPQAHAVAFWRERLHLASDDFVFSSDEILFGFGPSLSEFKRRRFLGDDITALMPVDWNYLAAFKESGVAVLSGAGPDGRGAGNYDLQELNTLKGVDQVRSVVQSIHGCHFQDAQDGQQCLVTSSLQILRVGDGVFDSADDDVNDAIHVEALRQVWLLMDDRILVLDYEHPTKEAPYGRWSEWNSTAIDAQPPIMGFVSDDRPAFIANNSSGTFHRRKIAEYTDDTSGAAATYNLLLRTGEFSFAGLGGEYTIQEVLALLENLSGSTRTITITLTSDRAEKSNAKAFNLQATERRIVWRPGAQARVGGTKIAINESDSSAAFRLIAIILEVSAEFHGKFPSIGDRT